MKGMAAVSFQVLSRNGRAPLRQEGGWKDTVAIEDSADPSSSKVISVD
jgi:FtsP/CotA-like multicopper oxidase with cupredoxin domain